MRTVALVKYWNSVLQLQVRCLQAASALEWWLWQNTQYLKETSAYPAFLESCSLGIWCVLCKVCLLLAAPTMYPMPPGHCALLLAALTPLAAPLWAEGQCQPHKHLCDILVLSSNMHLTKAQKIWSSLFALHSLPRLSERIDTSVKYLTGFHK